MKRNLLMTMILVLTMMSCEKDKIDNEKIYPSASYDYSVNQNHAPTTVYFENLSINATSYEWNFGDGRTSTLKNPQVTFNNPGNFNVTLTAINSDGEDSYSQTIVVTQKAEASSLQISGVEITSIPIDGWDTFSGPDIFFRMWLGNIQVIDATSERINDVTESTINQLFWSCSKFLTIDSPLTIAVYDYDELDSDDLISTTVFDFTRYPTYPSTIIKTENGVTLKLYVTWVF